MQRLRDQRVRAERGGDDNGYRRGCDRAGRGNIKPRMHGPVDSGADDGRPVGPRPVLAAVVSISVRVRTGVQVATRIVAFGQEASTALTISAAM